MRACPSCGRSIPRNAVYCPYCTRRVRRPLPVYLSWQGLVGGLAAGLILSLLWAAFRVPPSARRVQNVPITQLVEVTRLVLIAPTPTITPLPTLQLGQNAGETRLASADQMIQVFVPAGPLLLGAAENDPDANPREQPQYTAYLSAFWIDQTEVINRHYRQCIAAGVCRSPANCFTEESDLTDEARSQFPVVCVTWQDAQDYCQWAGRRLPTEAEWEKAARGPSGWRYPWGAAAPNCQRANFDQGNGACVPGSAVAGHYSLGASPYGALEMAGNAAEWTADWYDEDYYTYTVEDNPQGRFTDTTRTVRGGSWSSTAAEIRTTARFGLDPDTVSSRLGFRCAQSAAGGKG